MGKHYLFLDGQETENWKLTGKGRLTAHSVYDLLHSSEERKRETLLEIVGDVEKELSPESKRKCALGLEYEPIARNLFEKTFSKSVKQVGRGVPIWCNYIGASPDGELEDSLLEIKCPEEMYDEARLVLQNKELLHFKHCYYVNPRHFEQIQMQLAIFEKEYCNYFVMPVNKGEYSFYHAIVPFDREYWNEMYFKLTRIIKNDLIPLLKKRGIQPISPWLTNSSN